MNFTLEYKPNDIVTLFTTTFTNSEGADEGRVIGNLARDLLTTTRDKDLVVCSAIDSATLIGSIVFTRLEYPKDKRTVFLLSPAAVATSQQGKGVGQKLIRFGLSELQRRGVEVVMTYGDINFYSKVGFQQITEETAKPPLTLRYPHGWLGQSLTEQSLSPLAGDSYCVDALDKPQYW